MIYIFDKKQAIIKVLTNDDFTAAHLNFKINTATTFEFSLPASKALPSGSKYVATPHPLNDSKFIMLRLTERVDNTETIDYSAYELAYQELATDGYIEDKRPHNQSALNLMKIALDGSNWELNNVIVSGTATTNFYYVDRLSAISKVVDLLGGEIVFYIEIQGNAISGRYMDYLARQGADTSKVFASGSNLLTVERQSDTSNIYTAILPRGKGKEIDNGDADTPDGYGRRINIADVEWKKSEGKPLDKPKGSIVLSDPDATAEWGQINGNARLLLQTYDDIDDVNVLINSAYKTLQSVNHPQIQYSATVADVGGLSLGDTVLIMHGDRDLSYKTRVFEVKYDLLSPDQTELSLGDDLSSNSITSQINNLNAVADTTSSQTQWTINQIGRPGTTYGATAPDSPKVGDIWFKHLPDGGTEIYRWNGDIWELLASPTTADDIAKAVDDAVTQAKAHTDEVKQGLSSDIATAKSQAASLASTAEANAKSEATSLFSRAQNYVDRAKRDINDTINALSVGGRNLLLNSKLLSWGVANNAATTSAEVSYDSTTNMWHITSPKGGSENAGIYFFQPGNVSNIITKGQQWAFSIDIKGTGVYSQFGVEWSEPFNRPSGNVPTDWTRVSSTGTATGTNAIIIYFNSKDVALDVYIKLPKLETGNLPTDWSPAPEDVVLDYTTKDNKIKETITQYKETNDGHVSKLQTDVTTALGQIETKISQTDFNQKTGELSKNINEAKDTADKSLKTIADIQKADGKQDDRIAEIEHTANGIKSTVSDLSTAQDKQSGYISELQQSAKGFEATVTKVDNLSVGGRNLYLNSKELVDGYGVNGNVRATVEPFDSTTNMWHIVAAQGNGNNIGIYLWNYCKGKIPDDSDWSYSADVKGTGKAVTFGIERDSNKPVKGNIRSEWSRISQTGHVDYGVKTLVMYFDTTDSPLDVYIKLPKLETGNIPTDWTPAPEDTATALAQVKITADGISNFVRDSSGNISSNFQTALSKTSIITGSTLASSIQKQTATQISSAITDNNGKIISLINQDSSGVQIAGKNIVLDGNTTVTGTFKVSQANIANGAIGTAQIGDAAITSAKIANLDVSKLTGNVSNFIQSNWNGVFASTTINSSGMSISAGNTTTMFDTSGAHYSNSSGMSATYSFGKWSDSNSNATSATGLYLGATGSDNAFINILGTNGSAALVLAGSAMDYGSNLNVMQGTLNSYVNVNIRTQLHFKGNKYNSPSYIEINESNRTFNFFTGGGSSGGGNYFYFNQNVISAGTFSSTSVLSKKNVKSVYDEDALGEISKTQLVNFEYKNRIGQNHVSPIIDDVNSEKEYYIPKTILGQDNEYVDMYSMISMAWRAIQQLNEKIGEK
ncbi:phage tail spike protein [Leuconostoc lactis]|uniref:phage tail spike protein n=1 Tax=Leuconostoc lactis TaxID=1246 RepID=UPI00020DA184|nr:phage tail spike protein [Leuconostoc lactis]